MHILKPETKLMANRIRRLGCMHPIIVIVGPTAGGKTAFAIQLAQRLPGGGECISADSMQVYRGMDIGTAKPTAAERALVPHHLIDISDPAVSDFTVDRWLKAAERCIAEIRARGKWPIVVGGTNLYVKALLEGMFEGPAADGNLRNQMEDLPIDRLREELERIDPEAAARIHRNDRRRAIRAIEVFRGTGQPISALQSQWNRRQVRKDALVIGLDYPAPVINRRINTRIRAMMDRGLLDEVRRLRESDRLGPQAREALGYKQILEHLEGHLSLEDAVEQIKIRTRRFAKQQRTWLRQFRALPRLRWFIMNEADSSPPIDEALVWITAESSRNHSAMTEEEPAAPSSRPA
jgi:tRNA dimethylallyltransferase